MPPIRKTRGEWGAESPILGYSCREAGQYQGSSAAHLRAQLLAVESSSDGDASVTSSGVQGLFISHPNASLFVHLVNYQPGVLPCCMAVPLTQRIVQ